MATVLAEAAWGSGLQPRAVTWHIRGVRRHWRSEGLLHSTELGERTVRLRTGLPLAPTAQATGGEKPILPQRWPLVLTKVLLRLHSAAEATAPSSHSVRHGPRSRGGKTQRSPRRAQHGHPRQAGASGRAGSGRAPRPSWSCCSGCACWWTAGSGSGSGYRDNRVSQQPWLPGRDRGPAPGHRPLTKVTQESARPRGLWEMQSEMGFSSSNYTWLFK